MFFFGWSGGKQWGDVPNRLHLGLIRIPPKQITNQFCHHFHVLLTCVSSRFHSNMNARYTECEDYPHPILLTGRRRSGPSFPCFKCAAKELEIAFVPTPIHE